MALTFLAVEDLLHEPHIHIVLLVEEDVVVDGEEHIDAVFGACDILDLIDVDSVDHGLEIVNIITENVVTHF